MRRHLLIAAVTAVAALTVAEGASAQEGAVFATPGQAAYCNDYSGELICWTPNDGFTVHMTSRGRPVKSYRRDHRGYIDRYAKVLRFGRAVKLGPYVCNSTRDGLTCTNSAGHGWWLGRYVGYRLF